MSKIYLTIEEEYEFQLIGISCHSKNYKLCWELNSTLQVTMERSEDLALPVTDEMSSNHAMYNYYDEDNQVEYCMVENLGSETYMAPELKEADFFLLLRGAYEQLDVNMKTSVEKIGQVLAAFTIDPEKLKSKRNFLF